MSGSIFLLQEGDDLVEMQEQAYDSEDLLQSLLEDHSALLAGDQIGTEEPRRWMLIRREASVPDDEGAAGRWSLDHLFLDQEGIPTLVEVKRSTDTRIRREVVGQMLDYAANAVVYWSLEKLMAEFEAKCKQSDQDPDEVLQEHLGENIDPGEFWQDVKTNLQAGRVRMLFVADRIPSELRRVVEFLNNQMNPAEVLALEVKQYVGRGLQTLVPRVIGQTAIAQQKKSAGGRPAGKKWDENSFMEALRQHEGGGPNEAAVAKRIYGWAREKDFRIRWGSGATTTSFGLQLKLHGRNYQFCYVWTHGWIGMPFDKLKDRPPFDDVVKRQELRHRLNRIPGVEISKDKLEGSPGIHLGLLGNEGALRTFFETIEWCAAEVRGLEQVRNKDENPR